MPRKIFLFYTYFLAISSLLIEESDGTADIFNPKVSPPSKSSARNVPPAAEVHPSSFQSREQITNDYNNNNQKGMASMGGKIGKGIAFTGLSLSLASVVNTIIQHKPSTSFVQRQNQLHFVIFALVIYFASVFLMAFLI